MARTSVALALRHRRRYKNVILGIAVGTAGVIFVLASSDAVENKLMEHLDLIGGATVIRFFWNEVENVHPADFDDGDLRELRKLDHVVSVAPVTRCDPVEAYSNLYRWRPGCVGVDEAYWKMTYATLVSGRVIDSDDVSQRRNVCVLSPDVVDHLFKDNDPVGETLYVGTIPFTVIGTLGGVEMRGTAHEVYIPLTTGRAMFKEMDSVKEIFLRVDHVSNVKSTLKAAVETLRAQHMGYQEGLRVTHFPQRIRRVEAVFTSFKVLALAVFGVTLIVGGVGMMRVMLASIQERTAEIGLKKALGAKDKDIMMQFLSEVVLITLAGGLLGAVAGKLSIEILEVFIGIEALPFTEFVALMAGTFLSVVMGIVSGAYPAFVAARMDPVAAMRFE